MKTAIIALIVIAALCGCGRQEATKPRPIEKLVETEDRTVPKINFVGEQDGPPEQRLKAEFRQVLEKHREVSAAYLARVDYGTGEKPSIALCIRTANQSDTDLTDAITEVFSKPFGKGQHMDVIFISQSQEETLKKVCRPFYEKPPG